MIRKAAMALAISAGLLALPSARASAQDFVGRVYVATPPVYLEIGPPGPGYVWIPRFHRWEFNPYYRGDYFRDRHYFRDHDRFRDRDWRHDRSRRPR
jgi:hypothetical protein